MCIPAYVPRIHRMLKRPNNEVRTDYLACRIIILVIFNAIPSRVTGIPLNENARTGIQWVTHVVFKLLDFYEFL